LQLLLSNTLSYSKTCASIKKEALLFGQITGANSSIALLRWQLQFILCSELRDAMNWHREVVQHNALTVNWKPNWH